jgi:SAM-dependent methyltransferase
MPLLRLARLLPPHTTAPLAIPLDDRRAARIEGLLEQNPDLVELVQSHLRRLDVAPDLEADRVIARYARVLLLALRRESGDDPLMAHAARLDSVVRTNRGELLDQPWIPVLIKRLEMTLLDRLNRDMGSYEAWAGELATALAGAHNPHVMDLAAGSGGFARHVARHPPAGLDVRWTVTDLEPKYVAQGRRLDRKSKVPMAFDVRDALDLRDLRDTVDARRVDLFVCTQSTHHLDPGQMVRLFAQAIGAAERGILVVDLFRSALNVLGAAVVTTLTAPFLPLQLDGMQSVRRSYTPAELGLLARLAGARQVTMRTIAPAFTVLHATR